MPTLNNDPSAPAPVPWRVGLALGILYLAWGSTYFAIGAAVHTLPPFIMGFVRFLGAGAVLYVARRLAGAPRPDPAQWRSAAIISFFLILGGYGLTSWAQQRVPSGLTALLISGTPILMVVMDWLRPGGMRPRWPVFAGFALGLAGIAILAGPARLEAAREADILSVALLGIASCSWAAGSIFGRGMTQSPDVFLASAMQMLVGSGWMVLGAAVDGELARISTAMFTPQTIGATIYLIIVGSLLGFNAYLYLLKHVRPALASTYAYVNPVVAVFIGWALGGEIVTGRVVFASSLLLGGVAIVTAFRGR